MVETLHARQHLLESIPVAFFLTDTHSKILFANRQAEYLFGYPRAELEGQRVRMFFLEEDLVFFLPNIVYLTLYKDGFDGEALVKQKDGKKIFVHVSTAMFKEEGETFLTFSFQEIQRLKKLERERLDVERWVRLGKMVEEISHQIRSPITSIGASSTRLLKTLLPSKKGLTYIQRILKETRRIEMMVHRLEEYAEAPRPYFRKENIQEVVEMTLQAFSKKAVEKGIAFNLETTTFKGDGCLFIDRGLVISALSHLLQNSVEAILMTPAAKRKMTVQVALFEDEEGVGISIADKGHGIPKKHLSLIFEPFFSTRADRVGLGLTLVQGTLDEHGGYVQVKSRPQSGTTVTMYFPKDRRRKVRREWVSPEAAEGEA